MAVYKTVQRHELLRFLEMHKNKPLTIAEMFLHMSQDPGFDEVPAQSTIYRLIKELTDEGIVKRTLKGNGRKFVYQIMQGEECNNHLHMRCTVCGHMYHLSEETSHMIAENVLKNDAFQIGTDTVLSGKCKKCK